MIDLNDIAYCGPAPVPGEIWSAWNSDPTLVGALCAAFVVASMQGAVPRNRMLAAIGVLAIAFVSPFCAMTSALFSARAAHHLVVIAVAAPMIAWAIPFYPNRWCRVGFERSREAISRQASLDTVSRQARSLLGTSGEGRRASLPLAPTFIAATVTLWGWHVPAFYTAALTETWLYWLMQLSLLGTATLFWRALFTAPAPQALIAIAATIGQMGLLGALLTFAPEPMYLHHMVAPVAWGLTPLADQQLAGLIMWVPGNIPYAILGWVIARRMWRLQEAAA
ncbi:cytochrome c oxidase assembly protein [Sphingomonas sp. AX6]|uniref:cytochrome c oxidase assembly protein n=1 Tax=Sphingomonas sp. AX6 TaxID=2653171 RepID=UPI0012F202F7|nr:cytochrome c oxidase assembly protein [Sphingomonas sp. AX6]VXC68091.1 Cytochrome c oxidase caa3 assembly factor [Sphingomonas sp. AX6]